MKLFVGVTDNTWFGNLREIPELDEINFWQPGEHARAPRLDVGTPFLFKLHYPYNVVAGGGFFAHTTRIPIRMAWDTFEEKNGAGSYAELRRLIEDKRGTRPPTEDFEINCIILVQPFFFEQKDWIPAPSDWRKPIVQGKTYDTSTEIGTKLWDNVQQRLQGRDIVWRQPKKKEHGDRYGKEILVRQRLGQGTFRLLVTDIYCRSCAVTKERTLPTLEAAHIKPFAESGPNDLGNGILLRADIHHLLDHGYVTISPDYHFEVSNRIKTDFHNGGEYYKMHGSKLYVPPQPDLRPAPEYIHWHNENKFKG